MVESVLKRQVLCFYNSYSSPEFIFFKYHPSEIKDIDKAM